MHASESAAENIIIFAARTALPDGRRRVCAHRCVCGCASPPVPRGS